MHILVVDDEKDSRESMTEFLSELGHDVSACETAEKALAFMQATPAPLVITDIRMPGIDGLELLRRLKVPPEVRRCDVVLITGHGDVDTAITALRMGAYDYLRKPVDVQELAAVVDRSAERQALLSENRQLTERFDESLEAATQGMARELEDARLQLRRARGIGEVVAASAAMKSVLARVRLYHADPSVPVLIEGETGTGKEIVARLIHYGDSPATAPFVALNCAAIAENLFESELFGYEAGAFSGGKPKGSKGKLELAENGTLFLDEIGDMPLGLQPKLLRVLEDRTFYAVAGLKKREFSARVVCACNQDISRMVEEGRFRRDLFHRLNVGRISIPPLRTRREDILPIAQLVLRRESAVKKKAFRAIHPATVPLLEGHPWPGNVRELENAIQRAVLENNAEELLPGHLCFLAGETAPAAPQTGHVAGVSAVAFALRPAALQDEHLPPEGLDIAALNDRIVRVALDRFAGNKTQAAKYLGISRRSLYCRLDKPGNKTPGPR